MPRYKVIDGEKRHDGKSYSIGDEMEVSEEVAAALRLEPVVEDRPAKKRERLETKPGDGK